MKDKQTHHTQVVTELLKWYQRRNHSGSISFLNSLIEQLNNGRILSNKQIKVINNMCGTAGIQPLELREYRDRGFWTI